MSGITTTVVPTIVTTVSDTRESDLVVVAPLIVTDTSQSEIVTTVSAAEIQTTVAGTYASLVVVGSTVVTTLTAEQGPQGIPGADGAAPTFDATNKQGSTISAGVPCASHSSGVGIVLASASDDTKPAVGLSVTSVASMASAQVQTSGPFTLADWSAITGSTTLDAKARYYLSTTAGLLTTTAPVTSSNIMQLVGIAVSDDTLDIQIWDHVIL